jgi:hypothetical protein
VVVREHQPGLTNNLISGNYDKERPPFFILLKMGCKDNKKHLKIKEGGVMW